MKASLKFREDVQQSQQNPLVRAKIPVSVLGLPFISIITAGDPPDLSFSIRTNSNNGPSLKISYFPNTTTSLSTTQNNPFSISLKSGVGFFGSPKNSPLIMSAQFNLFGNPNPIFSLQIKPQFGDFSLKKTAVSTPLPNPNPNPDSNGGFRKENGGGGGSHFVDEIGVMLERPLVWKELTEFNGGGGDGFLSGMAVTAKTLLPIMNRAVVKFKWGVNFPEDFGQKKKLPFLTVDKIAIERVEEEEEEEVVEGKKLPLKSEIVGGGDLEMLKGMCFWMRKEVEVLQKDNRAMKDSLEEMSVVGNSRRRRRENENVGSKNLVSSSPSNESFEQWRNKKNIGDTKKFSASSESSTTDVGEELKRAIAAASSNGKFELAMTLQEIKQSTQFIPS